MDDFKDALNSCRFKVSFNISIAEKRAGRCVRHAGCLGFLQRTFIKFEYGNVSSGHIRSQG